MKSNKSLLVNLIAKKEEILPAEASGTIDLLFSCQEGMNRIRQVHENIKTVAAEDLYNAYQSFLTNDADKLLDVCQRLTGFEVEGIFDDQ